jgi:hypothetical protein
MVDLTGFTERKRTGKKTTEDMLLAIEFAGPFNKPADQKPFFIIDVDQCLVNAGAERTAEALRNLIRRTPETFKIVQRAINAMEEGSNLKMGGFSAEEIRTLRAATGTENIDPLLGILKADSTLPERMTAPSRQVVAQAERAKAVLAQIHSVVDDYKREVHPEPTTPQPA